MLVYREKASVGRVLHTIYDPHTISGEQVQNAMLEYRRPNVADGTYFLKVNTHRRRRILIEDEVRQALREGMERAGHTLPFAIDAWVQLSDYLHCLWTLPPGDSDFSARWAIIKHHVSQNCGHEAESILSESRQKRRESVGASVLRTVC